MTHSFPFCTAWYWSFTRVPPPWFLEAPHQAFTGRESDLDQMSRCIAELSRRVVYLKERDPDDCSPADLEVESVEILEVESMWAQVWGVLQRIYTIEDLILMSPDPDHWQWLRPRDVFFTSQADAVHH